MKLFRLFSLSFFFLLTLKTIYPGNSGLSNISFSSLKFAQRTPEISLNFPEQDTKNSAVLNEIKSAEANETFNKVNMIENNAPKNIKKNVKSVKKDAFAIFQRKETNLQNLKKIDSFPEFYRGVYISNSTTRNKIKFNKLIADAKIYNINTFVIDAQPIKIPEKMLQELEKEKIHAVARIVIFDGGLATASPEKNHMAKLKYFMENACNSGFKEIQFDYIRYKDEVRVNLSLKQRYDKITGIMEELKSYAKDCKQEVKFGADIFGRVPFNDNDYIGQKVENFSASLDILFPMLYPSHFYGQPERIKNPYQTVYDGVMQTRLKAKKGTKIIPYIQGFGMSIRPSGLKMHQYIKEQIKASYHSKSDGFIVWNAFNDYKDTFKAIEEMGQETREKETKGDNLSINF